MMDSSEALLNERRHKDEIDPVLPWPPAAKVRHDEPRATSQAATISPEHIDVSAEESCPAPGPQSFALDSARSEPVIESAKAPSATTFELMNQLDALAQDLAAKSHASVDQRIESDQRGEAESLQEAEAAEVEEEIRIPAAVPAPEPSIRVSPRPTGFETDPLAGNTRSTGRKVFKLAGVVTAALIGVGAAVAWQSYRVTTAKPPADAGVVAAEPAASAAQAAASPAAIAQSAPAPQAAPAPVAPEVAKQLETMAQDLAFVRRSLEQLTAKQEQLAAAQQQLEQLAAKQGQLAAKQEQMAQSIAKLQPREQTVRTRASTSAPPRTAPLAPRVSAEPPPAQVSAAPPSRPQVSSPPPSRAEPHPLPPLPVPQQ
jgi:hypothetical protein